MNSAMLSDLFYNTILLLALSVIYAIITVNIKGEPVRRKLLIGVVIGLVTLCVMAYPLEIHEGVRIDTRSVVISVSALFFGPLAAGVSAVSAIAFRILVGGVGTAAGILIIVVSYLLGVFWHHRYYEQLTDGRMRLPCLNLYILGLLVHTGMLVSLLILGTLARPVLSHVLLPVMLIFPVLSAYLGLLIRLQVKWRLQEAELVQSEARYRLLISEMNQGLAVYEAIMDGQESLTDCRILEVNDSFAEMAGLPRDQIEGRPLSALSIALSPFDVSRCYEVMQTHRTVHFECDGHDDRHFDVTAYPLGNAQFAVMVDDTTNRFRWQRHIEFLSFHDQLTGLYNRRFFEEEFHRLDVPRNLPISIIMADVNDLKLINDAFGHDTGDQLLKLVSEAMRSIIREDDIIARIGGDEFVVLLPQLEGESALGLIERIQHQIDVLKINDIQITVALGTATKTQDDEDLWKIYNLAEDAMYRNKMFEVTKRKDNIIDTIMNTLYHKNRREKEHSERVSELCMRMGNVMGMSKSDVSELKIMGLLHDIGKIALDESILNKPGHLTEMEWQLLKNHPEIGYRILSSVSNLAGVAHYLLSHHERWDGTGYPAGLKGDEIPLFSRIIALADAYDAMTVERTYRQKRTREQAIDEIRAQSGKQFDPGLTELFITQVIPCEEKGRDV